MANIRTIVYCFEDNELISLENSNLDLENFFENIKDQELSPFLQRIPEENKKEFLETGYTEFEYNPKIHYKVVVKRD